MQGFMRPVRKKAFPDRIIFCCEFLPFTCIIQKIEKEHVVRRIWRYGAFPGAVFTFFLGISGAALFVYLSFLDGAECRAFLFLFGLAYFVLMMLVTLMAFNHTRFDEEKCIVWKLIGKKCPISYRDIQEIKKETGYKGQPRYIAVANGKEVNLFLPTLFSRTLVEDFFAAVKKANPDVLIQVDFMS